MDCIHLGTEEYPRLLAEISDPPTCIWTRGDRSILSSTIVAVIGARAASPEGLIAAGEIASSGLLITELPPGTPPLEWHFPRRNRIISGLSRAVVVVEARDKSGSLITARLAADQGRDVMAVPGTIVGGRNRGANALLRDGAKLVESAVDILQELGLDESLARRGPTGRAGADGPQVVEFTVDQIAEQMKIPAGEALALLLEWELTGSVQRIGSGRFKRSRAPRDA